MPVAAQRTSQSNAVASGSCKLAVIHRETAWRRLPVGDDSSTEEPAIRASRWLTHQSFTREVAACASKRRHLICVALRATSVELLVNGCRLHQGNVRAGMVQVNGPDEMMRGIFDAPSDFLHLSIANWYMKECCESMQLSPAALPLRASGFRHDRAVEQLARAVLVGQMNTGDLNAAFVEGIANSILFRLMAMAADADEALPPPRVLPLAKWRLKRVCEFIDTHLAEPLRLADMAAAAGLTRMHFAAQFRSATGMRPRDYLLTQRIKRAQLLLMDDHASITEVAFSVGFENQAHFSTVFRRLTGESAVRWRQLQSGPKQPAAALRLLRASPPA